MKKEKMFLYKILKPILGIIYKLWYNPKIIGAENIPDKGSILIVGNHIHLMDQCNVIISTTRVLWQKKNILIVSLLGFLKM